MIAGFTQPPWDTCSPSKDGITAAQRIAPPVGMGQGRRQMQRPTSLPLPFSGRHTPSPPHPDVDSQSARSLGPSQSFGTIREHGKGRWRTRSLRPRSLTTQHPGSSCSEPQRVKGVWVSYLNKAVLVTLVGILPGQYATAGTRCPPSQVVCLAGLPPVKAGEAVGSGTLGTPGFSPSQSCPLGPQSLSKGTLQEHLIITRVTGYFYSTH